jgi:hypothetical protein
MTPWPSWVDRERVIRVLTALTPETEAFLRKELPRFLGFTSRGVAVTSDTTPSPLVEVPPLPDEVVYSKSSRVSMGARVKSFAFPFETSPSTFFNPADFTTRTPTISIPEYTTKKRSLEAYLAQATRPWNLPCRELLWRALSPLEAYERLQVEELIPMEWSPTPLREFFSVEREAYLYQNGNPALWPPCTVPSTLAQLSAWALRPPDQILALEALSRSLPETTAETPLQWILTPERKLQAFLKTALENEVARQGETSELVEGLQLTSAKLFLEERGETGVPSMGVPSSMKKWDSTLRQLAAWSVYVEAYAQIIFLYSPDWSYEK